MPLPARVFLGLRRPNAPVRGFDLSGTVETVGGKVTRFQPGDEVFGGAPGTFAEYASVQEDRLAPKPSRLTFEEAAAVPVAGTTALQGLRDKARLQPGQRVLINGAGGGVGTFAVQIARALGAHVTAVTSTRNLDLIRALGPDEVIDYTREDFTRREHRFDVVFDIAANRSLRECRRVLAPNGTFVGAGAAKGNAAAVLGRLLGMVSVARLGTQRIVPFMARLRQNDLVVLTELIESGKVSPVIDREYPLAEAVEAMRYVAGGRARAKVVIHVS
jgi:NADPH:quinone reductase-like Zn-dependent oxidoreductase